MKVASSSIAYCGFLSDWKAGRSRIFILCSRGFYIKVRPPYGYGYSLLVVYECDIAKHLHNNAGEILPFSNTSVSHHLFQVACHAWLANSFFYLQKRKKKKRADLVPDLNALIFGRCLTYYFIRPGPPLSKTRAIPGYFPSQATPRPTIHAGENAFATLGRS